MYTISQFSSKLCGLTVGFKSMRYYDTEECWSHPSKDLQEPVRYSDDLKAVPAKAEQYSRWFSIEYAIPARQEPWIQSW